MAQPDASETKRPSEQRATKHSDREPLASGWPIIFLLFIGKLSAGSVDIAASTASHGDIDTELCQARGKGIDFLWLCSLKVCAADRIVLNDIDFDGKVLAKCGEFGGIIHAEIETAEGDILVGEALFGLAVKVFERFHQGFEGVACIDGHDGAALGIIGGVQTQSQAIARAIVGCFFDHFGDARRADSDASRTHIQALRTRDMLDALDHRTVRKQRFAHAHVDDIGERMIECRQALGIDFGDLIVDLACGEIALAIHAPSRTKCAGQAAANLTGHTNGVAILIGHWDQHGLHQMTIMQLEARFDRAVIAVLRDICGDRINKKMLLECLAEILGQGTHLIKRICGVLPKPFVHLLGSKLGLLVLKHPICQC